MKIAENNATRRLTIARFASGALDSGVAETVVVEEPLEIRVQGKSIAVTMRTPGHDQELGAGFLLTEGVIKHRTDVVEIAHCKVGTESTGNILNIFLGAGVELDLERLSRHVFGSSSCGVCGKASIEEVQLQFPPITNRLQVRSDTILALPGRLRTGQRIFEETGGLHGAALFDQNGNLVILREDVGRHNAVDKVIGHQWLAGSPPLDSHVLMVSGRASFEIAQKALAAKIPIIAAISAPSSLAVEFCEESGQTLIGFLRDQSFNIYSHSERVLA
jgi:FdhD protein